MHACLSAAIAVLASLLAAPALAAGLFVSSADSDNVLRFDAATGAFVGEFVGAGSGGLDNPGGLAFGADGNLYVVSRGSDAVLRFNGVTGAFIDTFVPAGTGGLGTPIDLAFGPDGHLYVSNLAGIPDNILRFDGASGAFIDVFATEATFNLPRHVEFAGGVLWAAGEADRIWRFDALTGAFLSKPQTDNPRGLALGADGLMYSSSSIAGVFRHVVASGALVDTFIPGPINAGDNDLAFGPDGNLYMSGYDYIRRYDATTGAVIDDFVASGAGGLAGARYFVFAADAVPAPGSTLLLLLAVASLGFCRGLRVGCAAPATGKACASRSSAPATRS